MRGKYVMRDWEVPHLTKIVKDALRYIDTTNGRKYDFTNIDICPYNISTILTEHLGFIEEDTDVNNLDFWFIFTHPDYKEDAYLYLYVNVDTLEVNMFYEEEMDE